METVLLHSCCAPCSAAIIEWMLAHEIRPVLFYFNPNIFPQEDLEVIDGDWDHAAWLEATAGLEQEPERGARCQVCFNLRLAEAARKCHELGLGRFATTLASSRWKSLEQVNAAGLLAASQYDDVQFWEKNWRKDGLQERRNALLKKYAFYNQKWCGCEYSHRDMLAREKARQAAASSESNSLQVSCPQTC